MLHHSGHVCTDAGSILAAAHGMVRRRRTTACRSMSVCSSRWRREVMRRALWTSLCRGAVYCGLSGAMDRVSQWSLTQWVHTVARVHDLGASEEHTRRTSGITPTSANRMRVKARNSGTYLVRLISTPRRCEHTAVIRTTFLINLHSPIVEIRSPSARFLTLFVEHLHASQDASWTSETAQNAISKSEHVWHITGSKYPNRDRTGEGHDG